MQIPPVPATTANLCRYVAYLGRTRAFSTVQQYMNIIRILHLELGLHNPLEDNWMVKSLLRALKRVKSAPASFKLPLTPSDLLKIHARLCLTNVEDCRFWAAILCCFFGLLRISSVTHSSTKSTDTSRMLRRGDIAFSKKGCILTLRGTKTIQFHERVLEIPLPYIAGHPLCPTTAMLRLLHLSGPVHQDGPGFSIVKAGVLCHLTQDMIRHKLQTTLDALGLPGLRYGTHSLRRGGATWLLLAGVSVPIIKILGDWKSDCVLTYLKPATSAKLEVLRTASLTLPLDIH
jgi:integrase